MSHCYNPEADRRKPTVRIDTALKKEISRIAKDNRITECQALCEVLKIGLTIYYKDEAQCLPIYQHSLMPPSP